MRSLVTVFVGMLIVYSLYLLSLTWFVNSHEKKMEERAVQFVQSQYPQTAVEKYPGNENLQFLYQDTLDQTLKKERQRLLDSTKDESITWWGTTYKKAKENELLLGLDLQGGINVTMDIELSGMIKALSNNPNDANLKKALDEAISRKTKSDQDFITLFAQSFKDVNPGVAMAPHFANSTRNKLKIDASDSKVIEYIREEANAAMKQTYNVLTKRIDKFGVAQPNINLDESKGIITVELAGADDPDRVRKYLQSTANLQFFAVYNISELDESLNAADKALGIVLGGPPAVKAENQEAKANTTAKASDTAKTSADTAKKSLADLVDAAQESTAPGNADSLKNAHPLLSVVQFIPPQDYNKDGKPEYSAALGYVALKDTALVNQYLQDPAFRNNMPGNVKFLYGIAEKDSKGKEQNFLPLYGIKTIPGTEKAQLEGDRIVDARQDYDQFGKVSVSMTMDKQGERIWEKMTEANVGRPIAIVLDDIVYSAPNVMGKISGGSSQISGNFTVQEGQDLTNILKAGKLQAPAKIVQEQVVGPTLGQAAVRGGALSFIFSFLVIFALMLIYYNTGGWVANIALILNLLMTVGVLTAFNASLTAAGIAGLVLTIGMAVDTNVLIFERIKEELTRGKSYPQSIEDGYKRSLAPVLDGHITTLMTAVILFYFGLGPVLGFATTQIIGLLLSLLCGIVVSRLITDFYTNKKRHFNYFTPISRKIFKHSAYDFVKYRKVAYGISAVVFILGIAALFNGFKEGVEFSGGRSYVVNFNKAVDVDQVRNSLNEAFGNYPVLKTYGTAAKLDITTDYLIEEGGNDVDQRVEAKLFEGLKQFLPAGITAAEFNNRHIEQTKKVDATISDDLKSGAKWATFWSLLTITLYILIRFRDWRFSLGTVFSLMHDVLVIIIVFSFFKDIVPFPLEIDQHFIAAILTVIGFSMNDTVVVFDRVRENTHLMHGATKAEIINRSINETLSRTIMTSLTVFLTLLILFLVGGEVTKGFAFAMLVGVATGIYSSVFVAAPVLLEFDKHRALGESRTEFKKAKLKKPATVPAK